MRRAKKSRAQTISPSAATTTSVELSGTVAGMAKPFDAAKPDRYPFYATLITGAVSDTLEPSTKMFEIVPAPTAVFT